jgi:hypothetical protein
LLRAAGRKAFVARGVEIPPFMIFLPANGTGNVNNARQTAIAFLTSPEQSSKTPTSHFAIGIASFI